MESKTLTIMFTDLKDFTYRTRIQSRQEHIFLLQRHEEIIKPRIKKFGGKIIKTLGDSFLAVYESPTNALLSAIEIQDHLVEYNKKVTDADQRIDLKIGLNAGEVTLTAQDVSGDPVNVASRIVALAQAGQILFTEAVCLTMNKKEVPHRSLGEYKIKGIGESLKLYAVTRVEDSSRTDSPITVPRPTTLTAMLDSAEYSGGKKLEKSELEKVFDFSNVELEKRMADEESSSTERISSTSSEDSLELETGDEDKIDTDDKDDFVPPDAKQLEHSKEILAAVRQQKTIKKRHKYMILFSFAAFIALLFYVYLRFSAKEEKDITRELESSPVIQAMRATKTATVSPTPPSTKSPKAVEYADITVRSNPADATIWLNGKKYKNKTPTTIRRVEPDRSHRITVGKKGYKPYKLFFSLGPGENKVIDAELIR